MPRYIVQRSFPNGLHVPLDERGVRACNSIISANLRSGVTWVQSYVTEDLRKTFCVYDGPSPEAIRQAAHDNEMSADTITVVRVLDPYFYKG